MTHIPTRLLPEWHAQEAVILAWPDELTDWAPWLKQVQNTYLDLIAAINAAGSGVLLLIREQHMAVVTDALPDDARVLLISADYNDTWVRDYGFLTCYTSAGMQPVEFAFNGWGNKFDAAKDNLINGLVLSNLCRLPLQSESLICEGGALEIDQHGHLLSTTLCLQNPERNGTQSLSDYGKVFARHLGATKCSFLTKGHLEGDDTDGHIDTLVRFTPDGDLVVQSAFNRPDDSHHDGLAALVEECRQALPTAKIFELPLPAVFSQENERLPASYANYLICNEHVLCPVYQQPEDKQALDTIATAHPQHQIVAIDALPLIQQFGSVHCISMQVPSGTLKPEVISALNQKVRHYAPE